MVRRGLAAGAGLLVVILLIFLVQGCLEARNDRALQDYVRDTSALMRESQQNSDALFRLLGGEDSGGDVDVANQLNTLARESERIVERAEATDRPDDLAATNDYLIQTLELRRDGLKVIASDLPTAIAQQRDRREGTSRIAAAMQNFLASDVVYQTRVQRGAEEALKSQGLRSANVSPSQYLPEIDWLDPATVADRIGKIGSGADGANDGEATPGLHGNGIAATTLGGQALTPGVSANIAAGSDLTLDVQIANQGENTETDVKVNVTIGSGGDAVELDGTLDEIAGGETKSVEIPVDETPPTGQEVPITVSVEPVPGEEKTDNNEQEYSAIFTS